MYHWHRLQSFPWKQKAQYGYGGGSTRWFGAGFVLPIVALICLAAVSAWTTPDVHALPGTELLYFCANWSASVCSMSPRPSMSAVPDRKDQRAACTASCGSGSANHDSDGGYDRAWHHALLMDRSGRVFPVDRDATEALLAAEGVLGAPTRIAHGERCVTPLVYDVPGDARGLTLRIAWETAALLNLVDLVLHESGAWCSIYLSNGWGVDDRVCTSLRPASSGSP